MKPSIRRKGGAWMANVECQEPDCPSRPHTVTRAFAGWEQALAAVGIRDVPPYSREVQG